jgi:hypothetical protein
MPYRFLKEANQVLSDGHIPKEHDSDVRHLKSALIESLTENEAMYQDKLAPGLRKKMESATEQQATVDSESEHKPEVQDGLGTMEFSFGNMDICDDIIKKALQWYKFDRIKYNGLFKGHKAKRCPHKCTQLEHERMAKVLTDVAETYMKFQETEQLKSIAMSAIAGGPGSAADAIGALDAET